MSAKYKALSNDGTQTADVLRSIISSGRNEPELVQALIDDLAVAALEGKTDGPLRLQDAALGLLAVKTLGRQPAGSEIIATATNLKIFLAVSDALKESDLNASLEALRCIANALLLIEAARSTFITEEVGGGAACVSILNGTTSPELVFLVARILFLCTASALQSGEFIKNLVQTSEGPSIVDVIGSKLNMLSGELAKGTKMSREAATDVLKLTFNLLVHYPRLVEGDTDSASTSNETDKVMGDFWSSDLDGLLAPVLDLFLTLPAGNPVPLTSPLTHTIHALISIPITPTLRATWLAVDDTTRGNPDGKPSGILAHARNLLTVSLEHYFPGDIDPDDVSIRENFQKEGHPTNQLDDILAPLVVLITRVLLDDPHSRAMARQWMFPPNMDRSAASPLEGRPDFLGKVLRLLKSVYHTQLKNSMGEMLYAACESDPGALSTLVGYGNVAGFLFHKGIMNAPSTETSAHIDGPEGEDINPITGISAQPKADLPEMTQEEKEREAEKLFVLFDRMEKSGMMPKSSNPIRKAVQEGQLNL